MGDKVTEADVRLMPTVARYDAVYALIFKCSRQVSRAHAVLYLSTTHTCTQSKSDVVVVLASLAINGTHAQNICGSCHVCRQRIADLPHLTRWLRGMWQLQVDGSTLQVRLRGPNQSGGARR